MRINYFLLFACFFIFQEASAQRPADQISIRLVDSMPNMPAVYKMKDWKTITKKQDELIYNLNAKGPFLPLLWWDDSKTNFPIRSFGIPSYVGSITNSAKGTHYESLPAMGSIISATLVGINKSNYNGVDFVTMCKQFYNTKNGVNLVMNSVDRKPGETFWYEIFPGMAFSMLVKEYPKNQDLASIMKLNATKWIEAIDGLSAGRKYPDFNYTSYNFNTRKGVYNGVWHEPDAAAGLAWLEFAGWMKFGDPKFLKSARLCMEYLQNRPAAEGPFYELMMPYGAYLAVRLNAESGMHYDEQKMLNWCFDGNNSDRDGWGVTTGKWEEEGIDGLVGQKKAEQYAFAMNTFSQAAALVPIVKYNPAYSRTIGKWMLNLANSSRLFYADEHPRNQQSSALWQGDPDHVICYEGLRKDLDHGNHFQVYKGILADKGPYAIGDVLKDMHGFTDICPYGSTWVGLLAAIVDTTNIKGILKLNCNATDFYSAKSLPSFLFYNPYNETKTVRLDVGEKKINIYDRVSKSFLAKNVSGYVNNAIGGDSAISIVYIPVTSNISKKNGKLIAGDVIVDYNYSNDN